MDTIQDTYISAKIVHLFNHRGSGISGLAYYTLCSGMLSDTARAGLEVIKLEYKLRLKIKRNDWLLADTCPQAANHCALF